jgi:hypothetical protein
MTGAGKPEGTLYGQPRTLEICGISLVRRRQVKPSSASPSIRLAQSSTAHRSQLADWGTGQHVPTAHRVDADGRSVMSPHSSKAASSPNASLILGIRLGAEPSWVDQSVSGAIGNSSNVKRWLDMLDQRFRCH